LLPDSQRWSGWSIYIIWKAPTHSESNCFETSIHSC
jgi:hypothetical protein